MNVLFLTLLDLQDLDESGIYQDLLREFVKHKHKVCIVSPYERRCNKHTQILQYQQYSILKVKTGNIQKTNLIEKGISTILLEWQYLKAINKYLSCEEYDLVLSCTPPVTFNRVIRYVKDKSGAVSYLLLKDIFPQNAVDLGMFGVNSFIYRYFKKKEKGLYAVSDYIGCMSPANKKYIIKHNSNVDPTKVELCPNSIEIQEMKFSLDERIVIRKKYFIPVDKKVFVYGGNLGKPQGIEFLIQCLKSQRNNEQIFFLIIGNGTEYYRLEQFLMKEKPRNIKLMKYLPKNEYDQIVRACDIGMIFLDHRFTIPNFPSRLLTYMQYSLPVLACTDINTDIGKIIVEGGFGWWCESDDVNNFNTCIHEISNSDLEKMGKAGKQYLIDHYSVERCYKIIIKHLRKEKL